MFVHAVIFSISIQKVAIMCKKSKKIKKNLCILQWLE